MFKDRMIAIFTAQNWAFFGEIEAWSFARFVQGYHSRPSYSEFHAEERDQCITFEANY